MEWIMKKDIENDEEITEKRVRSIEKKLNDIADATVNITKAGENTKQTKRIKNNIKTKDNQIPILSGTYKDHKQIDDLDEGPDLRPIMGAMVGPNVGISNFVGFEVVRKIANNADVGNVVKSTEELQNKIEEFNKTRVEKGYAKKKLIVASMDVEKWYPNVIA